MFHTLRRILFISALGLFAVLPAQGQGQAWSPPSRQMPLMPRAAELEGDWLTPRSAWFRGVDEVSGASLSRLRATGESRAGSDFLQLARFLDGPLPAVIWSDRNTDNRADMIEIFRRGGVVIQVIDADYDGNANVLRAYDDAGNLLRENRL